MNKFTLGGGVTMAMAAFALTATVALACPPPAPKPSTPPAPTPSPCQVSCPPAPCSTACVSPNAMIWTSTNTAQSQNAVGNLGDIQLEQIVDTSVEAFAGPSISAKSSNWADQKEVAWNATAAAQGQTTSSGAAIVYPWGFFPAKVTAQSMGNITQGQGITGLMPQQTQTAMLQQEGKVDASGNNIMGNLQQSNQASGTGTLNQQQAIAGSGAVQGFAQPPFPPLPSGLTIWGNLASLTQQISVSNFVQFFGM